MGFKPLFPGLARVGAGNMDARDAHGDLTGLKQPSADAAALDDPHNADLLNDEGGDMRRPLPYCLFPIACSLTYSTAIR